MADNDTKAEEKNIWNATKENIDNDFEETRRCLLNSYNANVQAHAGYIIALMIGFFAIITTFESFIKIIGGTIVFSINNCNHSTFNTHNGKDVLLDNLCKYCHTYPI